MLYWREIKHPRERVHRKIYKHQTQIWWWSCEHTWLPFPSLHTELFQNTRFSAASFSRVSGRMCKIFHNFSRGWSTWSRAQCQGDAELTGPGAEPISAGLGCPAQPSCAFSQPRSELRHTHNLHKKAFNSVLLGCKTHLGAEDIPSQCDDESHLNKGSRLALGQGAA